MNNNSKVTRKRREEPKTPSYKYSFRLNEEQNIRFNRMLSDAGQEHNRSRFIVKRIFAERFEMLKRDPTNVQFIARLNDFYYQFQRIGNNYNQIVKAVNAHFSNVAIPRQIAALEQRTCELKALSIEILNLAKEAMKAWSRTLRSGSSPGGALHYNREKVDKGEAEVLLFQNMLNPYDRNGRLDVDACMESFMPYLQVYEEWQQAQRHRKKKRKNTK